MLGLCFHLNLFSLHILQFPQGDEKNSCSLCWQQNCRSICRKISCRQKKTQMSLYQAFYFFQIYYLLNSTKCSVLFDCTNCFYILISKIFQQDLTCKISYQRRGHAFFDLNVPSTMPCIPRVPSVLGLPQMNILQLW